MPTGGIADETPYNRWFGYPFLRASRGVSDGAPCVCDRVRCDQADHAERGRHEGRVDESRTCGSTSTSRTSRRAKLENWGFEMGGPNGLQKEGWSRNTIKIGEELIVEGWMSRNGSKSANSKNVTIAKTGQKLGAASSQGQGAPVTGGYRVTSLMSLPATVMTTAACVASLADSRRLQQEPRTTPGSAGSAAKRDTAPRRRPAAGAALARRQDQARRSARGRRGSGSPMAGRFWPNLKPIPTIKDGQGRGAFSGPPFPGKPKESEVPFQPWARALYQISRNQFVRASHPLQTLRRPPAIHHAGWRRVRGYAGSSTIYIIDQAGPQTFQAIYMDGRPHPKNLTPSYYGHSVGHWEGDTLVVDSVGFNERFWMERQGAPHTEQLHLVERFTRVDSDNIKIEVTIDDPGAYTKTWTTGFFMRWTPEDPKRWNTSARRTTGPPHDGRCRDRASIAAARLFRRPAGPCQLSRARPRGFAGLARVASHGGGQPPSRKSHRLPPRYDEMVLEP